MEENKKPSWEELSNRDKKAITKRMNKWFDMTEEQIAEFYNDKIDNYYDEEEEEPTTPTEAKKEDEAPTEKESAEEEIEAKVDEEKVALIKRVDDLEALIKAQDEVIKASQNKIDKAYEILEAQGKDSDFGNEDKGVEEDNQVDFGKSLFERKN